MKRRGFIASLFAGASALATSKVQAAAFPTTPEAAPPTPPAEPRILVSILPTERPGISWGAWPSVEAVGELPLLADEFDVRWVLSEDRLYIACLAEPLPDDPPPEAFGIVRPDASPSLSGVVLWKGDRVLVGATATRRPGRWLPVEGATVR